MKIYRMSANLLLITLFVLLASCSGQAQQEDPGADGRLQVVATTTIVGDVVQQVGGEHIDLVVLLPPGADPHSFDPAPQDAARLAEADLVFANGAGLEVFLDGLVESADASDRMVAVSDGIALLDPLAEHADEVHADEEHAGGDPHTWTDPANVITWVENIRKALSAADPAHADDYAANAAAYTAELQALDTWILEQIAQVPETARLLVTDHEGLSYFASRYGFEQVGALVPGYSTLSAPTARDLAEVEDAIRGLGVKAVFVGKSVNPALAERVAQDTGIRLVYFYTGSLSDPGGEAATYLDYMRYNVKVIVDALK